MGAIAIEINDAGLAVATESDVLAVEPGFARIEGGKIVTGEQARARARRQPRQTSSRFWSALSLEPGSAGADIGKSAAELAFAQLESVWQRVGSDATAVILVVPGGYRTEQLGLLLGLAQECGMPVRALVDAAAAASVRPYPKRQLVYLDASLYRVSLSLLEQNGEAQVRAEHALAQGLAAVTDAFARRIADHFVRATRLDPFTHAETEQALYDALPEWLEALQREERFELALKYRNEEFRVTAERDAVLGVAKGPYRAFIQLVAQHREPGKRLVLQLSDRIAALPGLVGELSRLDDSQIERYAPGHAARSVLLVPSIAESQGDVKLLKRVPWREAPSEDASDAARSAAEPRPMLARATPPTHVVYGGLAYRVGAAGLAIGREADPQRRTIVLTGSNGVSRLHCEVVLRDGELKLRDLSSYGTFVNERKVAGETTLSRADVIRIGSPGAELHVVDVEDA
ncbi:MAG TPA: FHA domain-containing protein [Gammaproteobacteria bacterium]|nr:FHA domain-containing protein [Gammaproteobacteria bacterium]